MEGVGLSGGEAEKSRVKPARNSCRKKPTWLILAALALAVVLTGAACGGSNGNGSGGDGNRAQTGDAAPSTTSPAPAAPTTRTTPATTTTTTTTQPQEQEDQQQAIQIRYEVLGSIPHSARLFTQGLVFYNHSNGTFLESTGSPDRLPSYILSYAIASPPNSPGSDTNGDTTRTGITRRVEPSLFSNFAADAGLDAADLPEDPFAEGLERVGNRLYQLTWRSQLGFIWEIDLENPLGSPTPAGLFTYEGEGWGLCHDGGVFYRSDGTNKITLHNSDTFAPESELFATLDGEAYDGMLNELECAEGWIWANVWLTNTIVRIDPATGVITGLLEATNLERPRPADRSGVLNGIAYNPETDTYWLTGKYWRSLYEISMSDTP